MRLIDADKFKGKVITSHTGSGVIKLISIDEVPTAYDVDKVVEQLRKMKPNIECFEYMNDYGEALNRYNNMMEIVDAGGVDKSNKLTLEQQIEFCGNKIENIKLKTGPETFVAIRESLKELQKLKQIEKAEHSE